MIQLVTAFAVQALGLAFKSPEPTERAKCDYISQHWEPETGGSQKLTGYPAGPKW